MNQSLNQRVTLAAAGVLFLLYPVFRPWEDETTAAGAAAAMGSGAWVASRRVVGSSRERAYRWAGTGGKSRPW